MKQVTLGRSSLVVSSVGYDLSPLEKISFQKSKDLLEKALDQGVTFFDIGLPLEERAKRIGHGTVGKRSSLVLAGSFAPVKPSEFEKQLKMVLRALKTDYLDLVQIHDPDYLPRTGDQEGFYDALMEAKKAGYLRSVGITTGTDMIAMNALEFGWYDTLQYPWSKEVLLKEEGLPQDFLTFAREAKVGTISVTLEPETEDVKEKQRIALEEIAYQSQFEDHTLLLPLEEAYTEVRL